MLHYQQSKQLLCISMRLLELWLSVQIESRPSRRQGNEGVCASLPPLPFAQLVHSWMRPKGGVGPAEWGPWHHSLGRAWRSRGLALGTCWHLTASARCWVPAFLAQSCSRAAGLLDLPPRKSNRASQGPPEGVPWHRGWRKQGAVAGVGAPCPPQASPWLWAPCPWALTCLSSEQDVGLNVLAQLLSSGLEDVCKAQGHSILFFKIQCSSVAQSCLTLCNPMDCSTPGLPVHHQLPEFTQTHVHRVSDAIQPIHPLSSPSPAAFNLSQHQGLFQWVSSSH